jgi:hypothetical protein
VPGACHIHLSTTEHTHTCTLTHHGVKDPLWPSTDVKLGRNIAQVIASDLKGGIFERFYLRVMDIVKIALFGHRRQRFTLSHHIIIKYLAEVRVGCESMIHLAPRLLFLLPLFFFFYLFVSFIHPNPLVEYIRRRQSQGRSGSRRCGWRRGIDGRMTLVHSF